MITSYVWLLAAALWSNYGFSAYIWAFTFLERDFLLKIAHSSPPRQFQRVSVIHESIFEAIFKELR